MQGYLFILRRSSGQYDEADERGTRSPEVEGETDRQSFWDRAIDIRRID